MLQRIMLFLLAGLVVVVDSAAGEGEEAAPDLAVIRAALGGSEPDSVRPSPIDGLYEVVLGPHVAYLSEDGQYLIQGAVIDLKNGADLTEPRRSEIRKQAVDAVGEENMVVFRPDGEVEHTVSVFTDIDCGYCRKLHREMADYLDAGIRVRYLFFPRTGIDTASYDKAVSVWCADNRNEAMTQAKLGNDVDSRSCENPVKAHYDLGNQIGVRGTPAIVLEDGELLPGYLPAERLSEALRARSETREPTSASAIPPG